MKKSKHSTAKIAEAFADHFNCLAAHCSIAARGSGSTASIAARDAVRRLFSDERLRGRRVQSMRILLTISNGGAR